MSDERQGSADERLEAIITESLDEHGDVAPPWARFPEIPNGSIGWRMGAGEGWDATTWQGYLQRFPGASPEWDHAVRQELSWLFHDER